MEKQPAMSVLTESARRLIELGRLGHLVTVNSDGSPQVSLVWVGLEADARNAVGMQDYLVVHGRARIDEGGAPELLQRLAQTYVGPGTRFPPMPDPPPGYVMRISVERVGGQGPWRTD
jgi:hypothetical protein